MNDTLQLHFIDSILNDTRTLHDFSDYYELRALFQRDDSEQFDLFGRLAYHFAERIRAVAASDAETQAMLWRASAYLSLLAEYVLDFNYSQAI